MDIEGCLHWNRIVPPPPRPSPWDSVAKNSVLGQKDAGFYRLVIDFKLNSAN